MTLVRGRHVPVDDAQALRGEARLRRSGAVVPGVTPAKAGVQSPAFARSGPDAVDGGDWIPAFAGMTLVRGRTSRSTMRRRFAVKHA